MDSKKISHLLDSLKENLEGYLVAAEKAAAENDLDSLRLSIHSIKGVLLNLGQEECAAYLLTIEKDAQGEKTNTNYTKMLAVLRTILRPLL